MTHEIIGIYPALSTSRADSSAVWERWPAVGPGRWDRPSGRASLGQVWSAKTGARSHGPVRAPQIGVQFFGISRKHDSSPFGRWMLETGQNWEVFQYRSAPEWSNTDNVLTTRTPLFFRRTSW